ncbi:IPT/TIG domain-containing protein [Chitinophaga vietnamensis]|uniref:IPT/TIG domain-containing protein n=1 Tax=Chitinophaga vietnamensis TaxID=2593957 RepID=UPI00117745C1|nr:IPT/TIG domain-containing protein [Chitinophaga vietnamensis]
MKKFYTKLLITGLILLFFLPLAGRASIKIIINSPTSGQHRGEDMNVVAAAVSTYAVDTFQVTIAGMTRPFVYNPLYMYWGAGFSLRGLPQGPYWAVVYVRDVLGNTQKDSVMFILDYHPVIHIESPVRGGAFQGKIHIKASVLDSGAVNCAGTVKIGSGGDPLPFVNKIDTLIDEFPKQDHGVTDIIFSATDSIQQTVTATTSAYWDRGAYLVPYFVGGGGILDFKDNRVLTWLDSFPGNNAALVSTPTFNITNIKDGTVTTIPYPPGAPDKRDMYKYGFLCNGGAALSATTPPDNLNRSESRLYLWRNDSLINLPQRLGATFSSSGYDIQASGNYLLWYSLSSLGNPQTAVTDLTTLATVYLQADANKDSYLSPDGEVLYVFNGRIYKYTISSATTQVLSPGPRDAKPFIDKGDLAYVNPGAYSLSPDTLHLIQGTVNYNLGPTMRFIMKDHYLFYNKPDTTPVQPGVATKNHMWMRYPDKTTKQVSFFSLTESPVAIGDRGRVLYGTGDSFYNSYAYYMDSLTAPVAPLSGVWNSVYRDADSAFYAIIGNTLFRYNTPSAMLQPVINGITPDSAGKGATVTIKGKNLLKVSAVSFGGTPASSFTMVTDSVLTAVVGAGASGSVAVITPGGTATFSSFTFIPAPTITSVSPSNATVGTTVTITGANFTGASSVTFGDTAAASFTVNSPTSITAVLGAGASGNVVVTAKGGVATYAGFNFVYSLPPTNFKITNTSATCKGVSDGMINIQATQALNYTVTITGNGQNASYPFTTTQDIKNLAAGTYTICLKVANQPGYQQCFTAVITEPKDLTAYIAVSKVDRAITLSLDGGALYHLVVNDSAITTDKNQIILPLKNGENKIVVSTDKYCQGQITKHVNLGNDILVYPNPFQHTIKLDLGENNIRKALLRVYDVRGKMVYIREYVNQSGVMSVDLSALNDGLYMLRLNTDNEETVFKLLKK